MNPNLLHQELARQLHAQILRDATTKYAPRRPEPKREPVPLRRPLLRFFRRPTAAGLSS